MKIVILGAGQVGSTVAEGLACEANDVTVVDLDATRLQSLQARIDVRTVAGHASHPDVLRRAGVEDADLILAVTDSDETNMLACKIAHVLHHTPTRLARVRSPAYLACPELFAATAVPIHLLISPEQLVTDLFRHVIGNPGVLQSLDFASGKVELAAVRADHGGRLLSHALHALPQKMPGLEMRVVAIYRRGRTLIPEGHTVIEAGDEVFFLAARRDIAKGVAAFRRCDRPHRRVFIAGGGNIGKRLAELTETDYRVKVVERDAARCRYLAETLHRTVVLHGDAGDERLLRDEEFGDADVFCAVTNDEEVNLLSAMLAKRMGARKVVSIVNRPAYVDLAQEGMVDVAVSPAQVVIGVLLAHARRGDIVAVHSLRRGAAEAIEIVAHGDSQTSRVVGRRIEDLPLPGGATIGAIVRGEQWLFPHGETAIEAEDHVILLLSDKRRIGEVERLFRVAIPFA